MTDMDNYWVVQLEALSFETRKEADDFRNKMEDVLTAMPDSETLTFFTAVTEKSDQWPSGPSHPPRQT